MLEYQRAWLSLLFFDLCSDIAQVIFKRIYFRVFFYGLYYLFCRCRRFITTPISPFCALTSHYKMPNDEKKRTLCV